ncbi:NUMOD3 motif (2 copies) [compost metagenome]
MFALELVRYGELDQLDSLEREQILAHRATDEAFGYNLCLETDRNNGYRRGLKNSPSHRAAISRAKKGRPGPAHTESSREAIRAALTGKAKSETHRRALSEALLGNVPPNLGVPHSEGAKRRMSAAKATVEWRGEMISLNELARRVGICRPTISHRMNKLGMTLEEAVNMPLRPRSDRKTNPELSF